MTRLELQRVPVSKADGNTKCVDEFNRSKPMAHEPYTIRWAGLELPGDPESHFGIVGAVGSGKTLALQALMRSVIPTIRDVSPAAIARRALVFDPENRCIPFLQELAGAENVHIVNPFDVRSRPWDLANEIDGLATVQELATLFIPIQAGDFWQRTSHRILAAALQALHLKAPGRWTLRQVFHVVTNEARLTAVLNATKQSQGLLDTLKPGTPTMANVFAALRSSMGGLEPVAALWDSSVKVLGAKPFTLKEWLSGHGVLVLDRPTQLADNVLGRAIFTRATQLIRAQSPGDPVDAHGRTSIFLDDLRNFGNLPGLDVFMDAARSRSTRVALSFQDIDGLREIYGERVAEEIANNCDTMSYLRCRGTTARWAAERLRESGRWSGEGSSGSPSPYKGDSTRSGNTRRKDITEAELSGLPPVAKHVLEGKPGGYVQGWHVVPALKSVFPSRDKDAWYAFENIEDGVPFRARPEDHQVLRPWNDATDWDELGFRPQPGGPVPD